MKFAEIYGQQDIKQHLQNAISQKKISHAYIISGEKGAGKKMLAEAFATTLLCEKKSMDACGECHSCKQMKTQNHPDVRYVTHEKPATISVEDIRQQINNDVVIKPYASSYKIYIVDEAEKMNKQAQNALLKTIEEPPEYAVILLLTTNANSFLPTILSRCVTLELKAIEKTQMIKVLMEKYEMPDYQANICSSFAQGNLGKAVKLGSSEEFYQMKTQMVSNLKRIADMDMFGISQCIKEMEEYKPQIQDYLDLMTIWFRDVLLYKSIGDSDNMIFREEVMIIKKQAAYVDFSGIEKILQGIATAKRRISVNGNYSLAIELLLLTIKENIA